MYLTHLSLANFRNYVRLSLDMPQHITVLQGANAQGKTNFLESLYYLATARSPHATSDTQLINWLAQQDDLPHARIVAEVIRGEEPARVEKPTRVEITLTKDVDRGALRKHVRINGVPKRVMDLLGQVNVVQFVPQDIALIDGAPAVRRRHLNITLCQVDLPYCRALQQYTRVLQRRNALLRQLRERGGDRGQLDFWDQELAQHGALIIAQRQQTTIDLEEHAQPVHADLSGGKERLRLRYVPSFDPHHPPKDELQMSLSLDLPAPISIPQDPSQIRSVYLDTLHRLRKAEIARGSTLVGPHRDELRLYNGQIDLHHFGSRGQQRTAVLALKLAEVPWMVQQTGQRPILLLDDVMSELDVERREYVCQQLLRVEQAVVTTTDLEDLTPDLLRHAALYCVSQGHLSPAGRQNAPHSLSSDTLEPDN
jgi:DNA replication and repair protein RecF